MEIIIKVRIKIHFRAFKFQVSKGMRVSDK